MSRADDLLARTEAIRNRDRAAAAEPTAPVAETPSSFRQTLDLGPDLYAELQRWRVDAAVSTGRGRISQHEVVYTAVLAMVEDEVVGRRVRALLAAGAPVPRTRRSRKSGPPESRTS